MHFEIWLRKIHDGNRMQWNAPIPGYPVTESIATNRALGDVKPTNSGLLLHYQSHVENRYKKGLLGTMLDREHRLVMES